MIPEPVITEAELMAELDSLRPQATMTAEQYKLVCHARSGENPIGWNDLAKWWELKGWGEIHPDTLRKRHRMYPVIHPEEAGHGTAS